MIGQHPYSYLTCISSWYICIPNITWIHLTITEKMNGNCHYQECDRRRTGRTSPYHKTSCFQWAYKKKVLGFIVNYLTTVTCVHKTATNMIKSNMLLTAPILSLTVSSVRGSWNQIRPNKTQMTTCSTNLVGSMVRALASWNARTVRYLYWVVKSVGHFLSHLGGCWEILSKFIKLACALPGSFKKERKI
jgi:hypothetical protein